MSVDPNSELLPCAAIASLRCDDKHHQIVLCLGNTLIARKLDCYPRFSSGIM